MLYLRVIVLIVAFIASSVLSVYEFPEGVNICKRTDSNYENCLTQSIRNYWSTWVDGLPSLGMPGLDPLVFKKAESDINAGLFKGNVKFRDLTIHGMAHTDVLRSRAVFKDDKIEVDVQVRVPKIIVETDYTATGNVNTFFYSTPVGGDGKLKVTITDMTAYYRLIGKVQDDRWVVEHFQLYQPEIKGMEVYFSDLLNGNKALNDATMAVVNQFWPTFFNGIKPAIDSVASPLLSEFVNKNVFSKIPASKLFPS